MTTTIYLDSDLPSDSLTLAQSTPLKLQPSTPLTPADFTCRTHKEELRHILLGNPDAIRQTIYLLHSLNYAEPLLWSPVMAVGEQMIITPEQGEAMSLLRRSL